MRIGLIGAMDREIEELKANMEGKTEERVGKIVFYCGKICGAECVVAQAGMGKVAAAVCAQTMILRFSPSAVINIGVAGGIGKEIRIGDLVLSESVVEHDMNTTALGDPFGYLSGPNIVYMNADETLLSVFEGEAAKLGMRFHRGVIASGDLFISSPEQAQKLADRFSAKACEMEGAAVGHACYLMEVPFLVLRSISDNANDEAKVDYWEFTVESAKKYAALLCAALPKLETVWKEEGRK